MLTTLLTFLKQKPELFFCLIPNFSNSKIHMYMYINVSVFINLNSLPRRAWKHPPPPKKRWNYAYVMHTSCSDLQKNFNSQLYRKCLLGTYGLVHFMNLYCFIMISFFFLMQTINSWVFNKNKFSMQVFFSRLCQCYGKC